MKRDIGIELYRCLLALGIVFIHVIGQYSSSYYWLSSSLMWCVDGFVFISGYFGIRFSAKKFIRLVVDVLIILTMSAGVIGVISGGWVGLSGVWKGLLFNWFIISYLVLMLCAPLVNAALEKNWRSTIPVLIIAFGWSYLASFNFTSSVVPRINGFGAYTPLTLIGIYVAGRLYRQFDLGKRIPKSLAYVVFCVLWVVGTLKLSQYNSPMAVVQAALGFRLFQGIKLSKRMEQLIVFIAPSTLAIFVGHANPWVLTKMCGWVDAVAPYVGGVYPSFMIVGIAVYVCALTVDLPRRLIGRMIFR